MAKTVKLTSSEITEKWQRRATAAVSDAQAGVQRVTDNPMEKAASKQDKMLQNLTKAVQSGKWAASLKGKSLEEWKAVTVQKMGERMAGGIAAATDKRQKFDDYLVNTINKVLPEIDKMNDLTIEDSIARMTKMVKHMHNNPYKK